eukprot:1464112-Prorocentrum_lima.AAC.1
MVRQVDVRMQKRELGRRSSPPPFASRCRPRENARQRMLQELALRLSPMDNTPRKKPWRQRVLRFRRWYRR